MNEEDEYPLQVGPGYICFWENTETHEYSAPEDEAHFMFSFIMGKIEEVFAIPGSFIGVIDYHGNTIQFDVRSKTEVWLDIPLSDKNGSLRKITNLSEAKALISYGADDLSSIKILGLEFSAW